MGKPDSQWTALARFQKTAGVNVAPSKAPIVEWSSALRRAIFKCLVRLSHTLTRYKQRTLYIEWTLRPLIESLLSYAVLRYSSPPPCTTPAAPPIQVALRRPLILQVAPRCRRLSTVAVYRAGTRRLKYWYPTVIDFRMRYSLSIELAPFSDGSIERGRSEFCS